ncbi:MAG TPA: FAD-dependent monooxygenase [Candidatus Acidoferrum sp.]|jgi:2-polyprenyl-6-methoxyphenol hydroxylase-like FAD-dependent oxidoreductase|nr:FAD-dependent monooxygenase [Candidatus Acidoferrum sp.]
MARRVENVDVLIVGAGPVGSALAIELGRQNVRCLVVERRTGRSPQPRAKLSNIRTMTLMRRWGLADRVRALSPLPASFPSDIAFVTRLRGWELTRFPNALSTAVDRKRPYPEPAQQVPQDVLEDILRDHARTLSSVTVTAGAQLESYEQTSTEVTALCMTVDGSEELTVKAKFIAGCDGAHSLVREIAGIEMPGVGLAANVSAVFRAPTLWSEHDKARAVHYWTVTPAASGILGPLNPVDLWWYHLNEAPNDGMLSDDEIRRSFFAAVGGEFACDVIANSPWLAQRRIATRYRAGNAFLLGDAAHLHPPMGGYGMNMGIGDAVDLGWKLGAVLNHWGGAGLLDSYEAERRPIHMRVIAEATSNFQNNSNRYQDSDMEIEGPDGEEARRRLGSRIREEKAREFASIGVQLGYRYEDSPLIVTDGSEPTPNEVGNYVPTARPGHLAPHAWVDEQRCIYDLLGAGFSLLRFTAARDDDLDWVRAAKANAIPLTLVDLHGSEFRELYGADRVLVRPDQHVAWRGSTAADGLTLLNRARGQRVDQ